MSITAYSMYLFQDTILAQPQQSSLAEPRWPVICLKVHDIPRDHPVISYDSSCDSNHRPWALSLKKGCKGHWARLHSLRRFICPFPYIVLFSAPNFSLGAYFQMIIFETEDASYHASSRLDIASVTLADVLPG